MSTHHLAQVNIAKCLAPLHHDTMQGFINSADKMNAIADAQEGFVWRLKDEDKHSAVTIFKDETLIVNLSVWIHMEALFKYTYQTEHLEIYKRKNEWFSKIKMTHMAFWYIPKGQLPTLKEAKQRLDYRDKHGDTPYAFSFKSKFTLIDALNYELKL